MQANSLQLSMVTSPKGAYLTVEGKPDAKQFFILRSGRVQVSQEVGHPDDQSNLILEPGDFFGVVSTMSAQSHLETAIALTDVSLIAVQRDQYGLLIQKNTPVAMKIILEFSRRMRYLDEAVTKTTFKNTATEGPEHLFTVGEYYSRQNQYNQAFYAYYRYLQHCPEDKNVETARDRLRKVKSYAESVKMDQPNNSMNRIYPKNTMFFSESEPGSEMFIIQKGRVKITKIVDEQEILIAILKPGEFFGEMALLENKPRSASAIAHDDDVSVLVVEKTNFERMVKTQAELITRLTITLAERIWTVGRTLANASINNPTGRLYDQLLLQLEKNRVPINRSNNYTFDFGPKELINMVGLSHADGNLHTRKLIENNKISIVNNRIFVSDVEEIQKQTKHFRRMEKLQKIRDDG